MNISRNVSPLTKLIVLTTLAVVLNAGVRAQAQPTEAPPEVRVLTYTNVSSHWRVGSQDWQYPDGGVRHGGGEISGSTTIRFHRYHGGYHRNSSRYHTFEGGAGGGGWDYFNSSTVATSWLGPCPADASQSSWWSNYTTWPGNETPGVDSGTFSETLTNYTWEPYESRTVRSGESVMNWTLIFDSGPPHQGYFEKWSHTNHTDTGLEVFGGGWPGSSNDVTMQLNVWAYDNLRQRYLTWNEMTVHVEITDLSTVIVPIVGGVPVIPTLDLTPDTNGNVFFLMQDNAKRAFNLSFHPTNGLPTDVPPGSVVDVSFWANPTRQERILAAVDKDRDRMITFASTNDLTSGDSPYVFWINDDHDTLGYPFSGSSEIDWHDSKTATSSVFTNDFAYPYVHTERDLEDFTRLDIRLPSFLTGTNWFVRLRFDGRIRLLRSPSKDFEYLTDPAKAEAIAGGDLTNRMACHLGEINTNQIDLPQSVFTNWADGVGRLLMEAGSVASGPLRVELYNGGAKLSSDTIHLDFKSIANLYERFTVGNVTTPGVNFVTEPSPAWSGPIGGHFNDEDGKYLLLVHGWNMPEWEKYRFAETALKRLYWQGFKGRFGLFTWPTFYMVTPILDGVVVNYDMSERNAWRSASRLRSLLSVLDSAYPGQVRLMAHSMGNVVAGEALLLAGTNQLVHGYAAMQAAIPAHCYDGVSPEVIKAYPNIPFTGISTPNSYVSYWSGENLPYMTNSAGAGKYHSYHNTDDYALVGLWDVNQLLKPDESIGYHYSSPSGANVSGFYRIQTPNTFYLKFPQDTYEIFSFGAESYSVALGASVNTKGLFAREGAARPDLKVDYGFTDAHRFHSGQFLSTVVQRKDFWNKLATDLRLFPTQ